MTWCQSQFTMWLATPLGRKNKLRYTPGQLREAAGLSKEALRHWRRVLPGFPSGNGHGPCFLPGDILASAIICRMTKGCGVSVGQLTEVSQKIFELCNETPWEMLAQHVLVVELGGEARVKVATHSRAVCDNAVLICPMAPIIKKLRNDLMHSLPFSADEASSSTAAHKSQPTTARRGR